MRHYLLVLMLFTFARASETFILLLGHHLGVGTVELLLLRSALNLGKSATPIWGGQLADVWRGTAFGWYHLMVGIAAIPAGLLFGSIWQFESAAMAFFSRGS